ncbi:MAG: hypothetical protein GY737_30105, partial [Desulfobacteraceae bacterium]|nr:hypothetical protein [Desulfobacteraceae bacterium]
DPNDNDQRTWQCFRIEFEAMSELYNLSMAVYLLVPAYFLLRFAKDLFQNEADIVGGQNLLDYRDLEAKLSSMFDVVHPDSYYVNLFHARVWNRRVETLDAFVAELRILSSKAFPTLLHEVDKFVYTQLRSCLNTREKEACLNRGAMTPADIVRVVEQLRQLEREPDRSFYGKQGGGGQRNFPPRASTEKKNEQAPSDPPIPPNFASPPPFSNANMTNFWGRGG